MEESKEFYKICPTCRTINGFSLPNLEIKKDGKYLCPKCGEENKLSDWEKSTRNAFNSQIVMGGKVDDYKGK